MPETSAAPEPHVLIEAYYDAGWTDGLPVVPPSDASIAAMLAAAGLAGHERLGEIPGRNTEVIAEIPSGSQPGAGQISVYRDGETSNPRRVQLLPSGDRRCR